MSTNRFFFAITTLFSLCCTGCNFLDYPIDHPKKFDLNTLYKKTVHVFPFHDHLNSTMTLGFDQEAYLENKRLYNMDDYRTVKQLYPGDILYFYYKDSKMLDLATVIVNPSTFIKLYDFNNIYSFFSSDVHEYTYFLISKDQKIHSPYKTSGPYYARYHEDFRGSDDKPYCMAIYDYKMER